MTESQAEVNGQVIEIDTGDLENRLKEGMRADLKPLFEEYMAKVSDSDEWKKNFERKGGKGVVEAYMPEDRKAKLIESFQGITEHGSLKEQWTITLPKYRVNEIAAHMRDFVYVTDAIKGKQGDTVNIPYVKDTEFDFVTAGTGSFTVKTGLVSTLTTSLVEAGAYYDAYYTDIEKIDSNLLDEINSVFAHAAVRSEDEKLLNLLCNGTSSAWGATKLGGNNGNTIYVGEVDGAGFAAASTMQVSWIADAIGNLILKGKDINPGELILVLTPAMYITLLKKLAATTNTAVAYSMPTIWTKGMVESYLGVRILVSGYEMRTMSASGLGNDDTSYQCGFLIRPKRCLALAPKREILIETDKQIAARTLRIVATHTFGSAILDQTEAVKILTGITASDTGHLGA
jgi:hypothetical protein